MENSNNSEVMKKSKKGIVILAIVLIAILAGLAYYFLRPVSPKEVFTSSINSSIDRTLKSYSKESKTINTTISLSGNIETTNDEVKQVADIINQGKLMLNLQLDNNSKKAAITADVDYQNQNLLSGKAYYVDGDNNLYLYIQDLFDRYFKISMDESGEYKNVISQSGLLGGNADFQKANKILKNTIAENLKEEYFSKETVDGMNKNTMKLTVFELRALFTKIVTDLKNNEDYLKCFEKPDEIKKALEESITSINDAEKTYDNYNVEISLYTKGIKKDLQKAEIKVIESENKHGMITINKVNNDKIEFNLNVKTQENNMPVSLEALTGIISREKVNNDTEKYTVEVNNIPDVGKVTLNIELKNLDTTDLDNMDVSNSVEFNKMTQSDIITLYTNLTKMKIYPYIAPYLGFF